MTVVLAAVVGFLALRFVRIVARDVMAAPALARPNYRDHVLPTAAGLLVVVAVVIVEAARSLVGALGIGEHVGDNPYRAPVLFAAVGFALLGFVDDLVGDGHDRGYRGHVRALRDGRVTTGMLKLGGGAAIALFLAAPGNPVSGVRLVLDALLIALAANLANLFDRAPGRVIKLGLVAWLPLLVVAAFAGRHSDAHLAGVPTAVVLGAFAALLVDDLHEHVMLGDTGANVLGAVLGLDVVLAGTRTVRDVVLVALVVLNLVSERVSFSRVIDAVPPLRAFDRLGSRRH